MIDPAYSKFCIQKEDGPPCGPYHWKRIIEWYEFGLLDDYLFQQPDNELAPIADLVSAYGVPPTISIQSILLAPPEGAAKCTKEQRSALDAQGFPEISAPLTQELADYIGKRLACSDQALDAEDPNFKRPEPIDLPPPAQEVEAADDVPAQASEPVSEELKVPETSESDVPEPEPVAASAQIPEIEEPCEQTPVVGSSESIEEVPEEVLESSAATPTPQAEASELVDDAPARAKPPVAMSFEELANSMPADQKIQNRWADKSKSDRKPIWVPVSSVAAIFVLVGTVVYVTNSSSIDPGQIAPEASVAEAPIEMVSDSPSEALTETSSDLVSASDSSESAATLVESPVVVEKVFESRPAEGEPDHTDMLMSAEAAPSTADSPEEVVADGAVDEAETVAETVAETTPVAKEASTASDASTTEEVSPEALAAEAAVDAAEGSISPGAEAVAEKALTEQADQPPVVISDELTADTSESFQVEPPTQELADTSARSEPKAISNTPELSTPVDEKPEEAASNGQKPSFTPTAPLEEFPDYVPSF